MHCVCCYPSWILNGIGLGNTFQNIADPDSQAYSGSSAIGPNPTRTTSPVPTDAQVGVQDGQISPTLPKHIHRVPRDLE